VLNSSVAGKAAREVLALDADATRQLREAIAIEWLAQSIHPVRQPSTLGQPGGRARRTPRSTGQTRDEVDYEEMMKQSVLNSEDSATEKDPLQTDAPGMMMGGGGMGGHGGMMGGGGMGMGGYGGGMMGGMGGGMGGYGMGGMYGSPGPQAPPAGVEQNAVLKLSVQLPDDVKPAAEEFLKALVDNLKAALWNAYEGQAKELNALADFAESRRHDAASDLEMAMGIHSPERIFIEERLDTIVDLSMLAPEMPFAEAIDTLRNAVDPPLPIVVMWKELLDSCEIEPTTPIDMDGLPEVKLKSALKALIEAVSGGLTDISYQIDDDVIVIREEELQTPRPAPATTTNRIDLQGLIFRQRELTRQLERLQMDLATMSARERAIHEQMARVEDQTHKKLAEDTVTQELQGLIAMSNDHLAMLQRQFETGRLSLAELNKARGDLTQARIELARRRDELSKSSGGSRLAELNKDLSVMAIDRAEMTAQEQIVRKQLEETQRELAQVSRFDPRAARVRIAQEALTIAERRLIELKTRLANFQPPSVTMIGIN